jgi:hypothetical protein
LESVIHSSSLAPAVLHHPNCEQDYELPAACTRQVCQWTLIHGSRSRFH